MSVSIKYVLVSVFLLAVGAAPAFGAGGGGGGSSGGSVPSQSAPAYDPAAEYAKGMDALKTKDFKAAKKAFDRVISAAPKDANTQYLAGVSRNGLGDHKGARKFLEKAVKLNPALIAAHKELGVAYAKLGDTAKRDKILAGLKVRDVSCAETCDEATELKAAIAAISAASGGATTGMIDRELILASTAQGDHLYLDAVALINENQFEEAIVTLYKAQESFGPHPDILTYLGFANRKMKRFETAERFYRAALAAAPGHRGATEYYGELMVERGDLKGARSMLAKLDAQCRFGCAEAEELRRWIDAGRSPHS